MNCNAGARPLQEKIALFWHGVFRHRIGQSAARENDAQSDRHVPAVRSGQFPGVVAPVGPRPGNDFLAGQQFQSQRAQSTRIGVGNCWSCSPWAWGWTANPTTRKTTCRRPPEPSHGWTIDDDNVASIPYGKTPWLFRYDPEDHDAGTKTFLGETGNFDGDGHHLRSSAANPRRQDSSVGISTTSS